MKNIRISIPKPCHENWDTMSQREQGRFCDKCCKTVQDFSGKTDRQIGLYISEHANEKICGRFRSDQLVRPILVEIPIQSLGGRMTAMQAFLAALLIVFGTTLFSCKTPGNEVVSGIQLSSAGLEPSTEIADSSQSRMMLGGFLAEPPAPVKELERPLGETIVTGDSHKFQTGKVVVELPQVTVCEEVIREEVTMISGGVNFLEYVEESEPVVPDSDPGVPEIETVKEAQEILVRQAVIYPNPAHDKVGIKLNLESEENVEARLIDMDGKLIRVVAAGTRMQAGENVLEFDASGLPRGIYLLQLCVGLHEETKRLILN